MITNNNFWFKPLLIPFGNYIPIKYDLSDLEEKIEWVLEHDFEAREIAERATTFAYHIFTPEFQRESMEDFFNYLIAEQPELAEKAGVGLRFLRELEQGKQTLRLDKINQVLWLFGHEMGPVPQPRPTRD